VEMDEDSTMVSSVLWHPSMLRFSFVDLGFDDVDDMDEVDDDFMSLVVVVVVAVVGHCC
jgi:hypothetical protein